MKRFLTISAAIFVVVLAIFAWQLPTILRAMPSRYVSLLPAPIQELGVREHVEVLPTAAVAVELSLEDIIPPTETATPTATFAPPSTPTPEIIVEDSEVPPTATPLPTATPIPSPTPIPFDTVARLNGIQHQFQSWNNCGPATLAMSLSHFDLVLRQEQTADWLKPNPEDRNVTPAELVAYVERETELMAITRANGDLDTLRRFLSNGIPVIIETGIDPPGDFAWMEWYGHYYLAVAYDEENLWVYDSWLGTEIEAAIEEREASEEGRPIPLAELDRFWRHFNRQYVAIYRPDQAQLVQDIIGEQLDDQVMWQRALDVNLRELEAEPENPYLWFNLGQIYIGLSDYESAAKAFDRARQIGLPWRMLWYQFGPYEAYWQVGRYSDVIALADVTLHQRPYFEESYYYRALAFQAIGDTNSAIQDLRRAVDFNPRYTAAVESLEQLQNNN